MKMPLDWPRINQFPEWFTVEYGKSYQVTNLSEDSKVTFTGKQLHKGLDIQLQPSGKQYLLVNVK